MIARLAATVVDGELKLDEPVPLPARTRVTITIEMVSDQPTFLASSSGPEVKSFRRAGLDHGFGHFIARAGSP